MLPSCVRSNDVLRAEDVSLGPKGEATMFEVGEKEGVILPTSCWEALENACLMHRPDDRRGFYFRLGSPGSKVNYDEPLGSAWFERKAVPIAGESTVYCVPWEPPVGTLDEAQSRYRTNMTFVPSIM